MIFLLVAEWHTRSLFIYVSLFLSLVERRNRSQPHRTTHESEMNTR
uniref:Uncharacterized protein n=1 Tax=Anopheles christyi TaxID=43041 RepID=A0A182KHN4_9DIPT